jgi:HEAT repeat protein
MNLLAVVRLTTGCVVVGICLVSPAGAAEAQSVEQWLAWLNSPDHEVSLSAVRKLEARGTESLPVYAAAIQCNNPQIRLTAQSCLANLGQDGLPTLEAMLNHSDQDVRERAALAIFYSLVYGGWNWDRILAHRTLSPNAVLAALQHRDRNVRRNAVCLCDPVDMDLREPLKRLEKLTQGDVRKDIQEALIRNTRNMESRQREAETRRGKGDGGAKGVGGDKSNY